MKSTAIRACLRLCQSAIREGAAFASSEGVGALKINSSNVKNISHCRNVAAFGKPMLIDTGGATLGEIESAVRPIRKQEI